MYDYVWSELTNPGNTVYVYSQKRQETFSQILFFRIVCFRGPSEEGVKKAGQKDLIEGECQDCSTSERKTVIQLFYRKK